MSDAMIKMIREAVANTSGSRADIDSVLSNLSQQNARRIVKFNEYTYKTECHDDGIEWRVSRQPTKEAQMELIRITYSKVLDDYCKKELDGKELFKCKETSSTIRHHGNYAYQQSKNFMEAHKLFTKSIAVAPMGSEELYFALANRSAVLRSMGKLEECIKDVKNAINHGYPRLQSFRLLLRVAVCQRDLGNTREMRDAFSQVAKLVEEEIPEKERQALRQQAEKERKAPKAMKPKSEQQFYPAAPPLSYGPGKEMPTVSRAVELKYNKTFGRHLVTTQDIKIGDVLIVEPSYAKVLDFSKSYQYCGHCLLRCYTLLPCNNCKWVMFCSAECESAAMTKYHQVECPVLSRLAVLEDFAKENPEDKFPALTVRILATAGLEALECLVQEEERFLGDPRELETLRTRGFNPEGQYVPTDIHSVYHLPSHEERVSRGSFVINCKLALEIAKTFQLAGFAVSQALRGLILHVLHITYCNSENMVETSTRLQDLGGKELKETMVACENVGSGVSTTLSLVAPSCCANVQGHDYGSRVVMHAMEPIPKGAMLTGTFVSQYFSMPKQERRFKLKQCFYLDCPCEACSKDWPVFEKLPHGMDVPIQRALRNIQTSVVDRMRACSGTSQERTLCIIRGMEDTIEFLYKRSKRNTQTYVSNLSQLDEQYKLFCNRVLLPATD